MFWTEIFKLKAEEKIEHWETKPWTHEQRHRRGPPWGASGHRTRPSSLMRGRGGRPRGPRGWLPQWHTLEPSEGGTGSQHPIGCAYASAASSFPLSLSTLLLLGLPPRLHRSASCSHLRGIREGADTQTRRRWLLVEAGPLKSLP